MKLLTRSEMRVYIIRIRNKPKAVKSILRLKLLGLPMPLLKKDHSLFRAKTNLKR